MNIRTPRVFLALGYLSLLSTILIGCRQKTKTTTGNTNGNATANAPDSKGIEKGSDDSTKITDLDPTTALVEPRLDSFNYVKMQGPGDYGYNPTDSTIYTDKRLKEALESARANPSNAYSYIILGVFHYNLKQYEKAITNFEIAIALPNTRCEAPLFQGNAYIKLKKYEKAIAIYNSLLKDINDKNRNNYSQENACLYNHRGVAYYNLNQFDKALADFTEMEKYNSNHRWHYNNNMGATFNALKEYDKAIQYCTEAINISVSSALGYSNRGTAYLNLKQMDKAIADYTLAITFEPQLYPAQGTVYKTLGKTKPAPKDAGNSN